MRFVVHGERHSLNIKRQQLAAQISGQRSPFFKVPVVRTDLNGYSLPNFPPPQSRGPRSVTSHAWRIWTYIMTQESAEGATLSGAARALLIATDTYEDERFDQLFSPRADVEALEEVLTDSAIGGYKVGTLINAPLQQANEEIDSFLEDAALDDLVLLYFSGHGTVDHSGRLYIAATNSRFYQNDETAIKPSTAIFSHFIKDQLEKCRSKRKILMLDCCYAGAFEGNFVSRDSGKLDVLGGLSGHGSAVITASSAVGKAWELRGSGLQVITEPSVFTGALVEGLRTGNADLGGDGYVDINELYRYLYRRVKEMRPDQSPGWISNLEGSIYVARSPRGVRPTELPDGIREAMQNPNANIRQAVVSELMSFADGNSDQEALAACIALSELADDDSRKVHEAAHRALDRLTDQLPRETVRLVANTRPPSRAPADSTPSAKQDVAGIEMSKARELARLELEKIISAAQDRANEIYAEATRQYNERISQAEDRAQEITKAAERRALLMEASAQEVVRAAELQARRSAGSKAAPSSVNPGGAERRGLGRLVGRPEPEPEVPGTKLVRQQPVRQSRSKRSGKR